MTRHFILDGLMKAQEATMRGLDKWIEGDPDKALMEQEDWHECDGCSKELPESEMDLCIKHDCGERDQVWVCYGCIKTGWHTWGDPRT